MRGNLKDFFKDDNENTEVSSSIKIDENKIKEIAVIGMAVKMPMAESLDDFWENIRSGMGCVRNFPLSRRKDTDDYLKYTDMFSDGFTYDELACLDEIDKFDYEFFNISPTEASLMDPHQRLFLETAWKAIEDAGYGGDRLVGSRTGVYVGHIGQANYKKLVSDIRPSLLPFSVSGNIPQMVASRISYILDLKGPSMLVDTACSSSLVSIHLACQAIRNKECESAIVGGIKINLLPINMGDRFGVESSDGRTRTFDEESDGTGNGEGAAVVVLKPLYKALEDKDRIYAVIKGSFINQDGSSLGITAPNPEAQEDVIVKAWKDAGIDPHTVTYIEVHGTATKLGDPIEVEGIKRAFRRHNAPNQFCAVGSIKTNIGHLDSAAGIAGFVKSVLALKNGIIPPSINFMQPNRKISFESSPVYVNTKPKKWKSLNIPRRCGVSSFGLGGTNCHIVLEEPPKEKLADRAAKSDGILVLTLSAKNEHALKTMVEEYKYAIEKLPEDRVWDACYSASICRGHYNYRIAIIAKNYEELRTKLEEAARMESSEYGKIKGLYYGKHKVVNSDKEILESGDLRKDEVHALKTAVEVKINEFILSNKENMEAAQEICSLYVKGANIDWQKIYGRGTYRQIEIPTYPFQKERCWLEISPDSQENMDKSQYYYKLGWRSVEDTVQNNCVSPGVILIFRGEWEHNDEIIHGLKNMGAEIIEVSIEKTYKKVNDNLYEIRNCFEDYQQLFSQVDVEKITKIVHMLSLGTGHEVGNIEELDNRFDYGVYSLFRINKALSQCNFNTELDLIVISDNAGEVTGIEDTIKPEDAALFGIGKVINIENPKVKCRCIDIDSLTESRKLISEIMNGYVYYKTAYRHGKRFIEQLEAMDDTDGESSKIEVSSDGVHIITGGTGGLGLVMARFLSSLNKVNIALISRSEVPDRNTWDQAINKREDERLCGILDVIKEIEDKGSKVTCLSCDVSNEDKMSKVITELKNTYGKINGIIHCAGVGVGKISKILAETRESELRDSIAAKVHGSWILQKLTTDENLDFFACFSSPISLMGGLGQGGYTCANSYLDSFPYFCSRKGKRAFSVGWAPWEKTVEKMGDLYDKDKQLFNVLSTSQLVACFEQLLTKNIRTVFVGNMNYASTMFRHREDELALNFSKEITARAKNTLKSKHKTHKDSYDIVGEVKLTGNKDSIYSEVEVQVAQLIGKSLGHKQINIHDNFYELGGDSIHAMRIINQINKLFSIRIEISELLKHANIQKFAAHLDRNYLNDSKAKNVFSNIERVEEREFYPLSSAQKRLFILNQIESDSIDYNWPIILKLRGNLDKVRLEKAFTELVKRHESLRTSYLFIDGEPMQKVHKDIEVTVSYKVSEKENMQKIIEESIRPFNLEKVPLFNIVVMQLNDDEHILFFDMHHIISDGITTNILVKEFSDIYNGNELPPMSIQYKDYACWQNAALKGENIKNQEEYWLSKLNNFSYTELPRKSVADQGKKIGAEIKMPIDEELTKSIDNFCAKYKITRYVFMLAIFNIVLYKEINQENICIGTPVTGRRHSDLEDIVGIFLNVLCIDSKVLSTDSVADYLKALNSTIIEAWDNQDYPYEELYTKFIESKGIKLKSLFSILFNYVPASSEGDLFLDGITVEKYKFDIAPKYDMTLYVRESRSELLLDAVYISNYYEDFRINRILNNMMDLIRKTLSNPNILIKEINFEQESGGAQSAGAFEEFFDNEEFL